MNLSTMIDDGDISRKAARTLIGYLDACAEFDRDNPLIAPEEV